MTGLRGARQDGGKAYSQIGEQCKQSEEASRMENVPVFLSQVTECGRQI
jgi:hypothetical protein